jgi:hypothetical protein
MGMECVETGEDERTFAILRDPFITLRLDASGSFSKPGLTFYHPEMPDKVESLKMAGIADQGQLQEVSDHETRLLSPEGVPVFLRKI